MRGMASAPEPDPRHTRDLAVLRHDSKIWVRADEVSDLLMTRSAMAGVEELTTGATVSAPHALLGCAQNFDRIVDHAIEQLLNEGAAGLIEVTSRIERT